MWRPYDEAIWDGGREIVRRLTCGDAVPENHFRRRRTCAWPTCKGVREIVGRRTCVEKVADLRRFALVETESKRASYDEVHATVE